MTIDRMDEEILYAINNGSTNAYRVWITLGNPIAYKNVYLRVRKLAKSGMLERIKIPPEIDMHGRKDYRVSKEGKIVIRQRIKRLQEIVK